MHRLGLSLQTARKKRNNEPKDLKYQTKEEFKCRLWLDLFLKKIHGRCLSFCTVSLLRLSQIHQLGWSPIFPVQPTSWAQGSNSKNYYLKKYQQKMIQPSLMLQRNHSNHKLKVSRSNFLGSFEHGFDFLGISIANNRKLSLSVKHNGVRISNILYSRIKDTEAKNPFKKVNLFFF